ncbi:MAG: MBL fold metallo-hydrolase [Candidatus Sifarchaeia archaeon]
MTKVVLLGTGTPNPEPLRSGPSLAIIVGYSVYIVDSGPGVVRRLVEAGISPSQMTKLFITHLHSDHTTGYPDIIFTPGVVGRTEPLEVYGPKGISEMTKHIIAAYEVDVKERLSGLEPADAAGYVVNTHEIQEGVIYQDENVQVMAFKVDHGSLDSYGYKFVTKERIVVISGDTAPSQNLVEMAKGSDILIHEVYSAIGLQSRPKEWQHYHSSVHTSSYELANIARTARPSILVMYHQLLWGQTEEGLISEVSEHYTGEVTSGNDLEVY